MPPKKPHQRTNAPPALGGAPITAAPITAFMKPPGVRTFFVSGHIDIEEAEFLAHYSAALDAGIAEGGAFVIGDAPGVDLMAQKYVLDRAGERNIAVFCRGDTPRCVASKKLKVFSGFQGHTQKDAAMTRASDVDIAWVRSAEEQMAIYGEKYRPRVSGTEKNLIRRKAMQPVTSPPTTEPTAEALPTGASSPAKSEGDANAPPSAVTDPSPSVPSPAPKAAKPNKKKNRVMF